LLRRKAVPHREPRATEDLPWLEMIRDAETIDVLSLLPHEKTETADGFHGFSVLGNARVADDVTRSHLIADLIAGLLEPVSAAACFLPRHGVRAASERGVIDLVICFECNQVRVFPKGWTTTISRRPHAALARVLQEAQVPLSEE
jgi:hypothetical protein